ncbi:MAG: hypothetical protein GF372_08135 [Candidatus Marinimicrobia bacterium]|nr:hypothetical protein [Candidatus Neomarinimicrobiota bacterium]
MSIYVIYLTGYVINLSHLKLSDEKTSDLTPVLMKILLLRDLINLNTKAKGISMMKRSWSVYTIMLVMLFLAYPLQETEAAKRTIKIEGNDQMQYSVTEIQASPGDTLKIQLITVSNLPDAAFMSHNWVLLKKDANVQSFVNASIRAESNGYVAPNKKDDIIALTGLADKGETTEVTFAVPSEPGEYTYVCTFPGHFDAGMVGTLIVSG